MSAPLYEVTKINRRHVPREFWDFLSFKDTQGQVFWAHDEPNFYSDFWQDLSRWLEDKGYEPLQLSERWWEENFVFPLDGLSPDDECGSQS